MTFILAFFLLNSWVQVRSDTFVVKSLMGGEQATEVLAELENFYQIVGGELFQGVRTPDLPLEVLVLDRKEVDSLSPRFEGATISVNGFYQKGIDRDFIVLSADLSGRVSTQVAYHELSHYLISRAMARPPTWLNEGFGEYFGAARIEAGHMEIGTLQTEKLDVLATLPILPLAEFFAVDPSSSYYNEQNKASVFYSQAWAFVHFLMHGPFSDRFADYIGAMRLDDVDLLDYLPVDLDGLERRFRTYLRFSVRSRPLEQLESSVELIPSAVQPIDRAEVDVSLAEMLISNGRIEAATPYLDAATAYDAIYPRVAYSRGILAWLGGDPSARDHFVDALIEPEFGPFAAYHLVQMKDLNIPEVQMTLEQAAQGGSREPLVYWALSEIYLEEMRRIASLVEVASSRHVPPPLPFAPRLMPEIVVEAEYEQYASQTLQDITYELWAIDPQRPAALSFALPYYPDDLKEDSGGGEVVLDVQLSPEGDVMGVWLIEATPDIFGNLASVALRDSKFEAVAAKIRVIVRFLPGSSGRAANASAYALSPVARSSSTY